MANEELSSKLVEILTSIQSTVGAAKDFTLAQLPDVAQSYVVYGRVEAAIWVMGWLAAVMAMGWLTRYIWKNPTISTWSWDAGKNKRSEESWLLFFFSGAGLVGTCLGFLYNLQASALVWFAPKVWLLKEIAHLLK